jgi:hypothetical protein
MEHYDTYALRSLVQARQERRLGEAAAERLARELRGAPSSHPRPRLTVARSLAQRQPRRRLQTH